MTASEEPDLYAVLGVSPDATRAEISRAFRREALAHHPDRGGDAEAFRSLDQARETLLDPVRRAAYDRRRRATPTPRAHRPATEPQSPAADPFAWAPGAGPGTGARSGPVGDDGVYAVPFPAPDPDSSWRRDDRFAWWKPADEPRPKRWRRRR